MDINILEYLKRAIAGPLWMLMTKGMLERIMLLEIFFFFFTVELFITINFSFTKAYCSFMSCF